MSKRTDLVIKSDDDENVGIDIQNPINVRGISITEKFSTPNTEPRVEAKGRPETKLNLTKQNNRPVSTSQRRSDARPDNSIGLDLLANPQKINQDAQDDIVEEYSEEDEYYPEPQNDEYHQPQTGANEFLGNEPFMPSKNDIPAPEPRRDRTSLRDRLKNRSKFRKSKFYGASDSEGHEFASDAQSDLQSIDDFDSASQMSEYNTRPMTYEEIQKRKHEILYVEIPKYERKGIRCIKRLTMSSEIDEMEQEVRRMSRQYHLTISVRFQRRMLMACITGVEFLNHRFDPFSIYLDGWSESIMEDVGSYDDVFEELYDKYNQKVSMAPELKLMFMVGGSAFWFHMTNTMFKSAAPGLQQNPEFMAAMRNAAAAAMKTPGMPGMPGSMGGMPGMGAPSMGGMPGMGNMMGAMGSVQPMNNMHGMPGNLQGSEFTGQEMPMPDIANGPGMPGQDQNQELYRREMKGPNADVQDILSRVLSERNDTIENNYETGSDDGSVRNIAVKAPGKKGRGRPVKAIGHTVAL